MSVLLIVERRQTKPVNPVFDTLKRLSDIAICLLALPFLAIITVIVGALIKWDSPGPIFFKQKRIGKDGREFDIYKFRTMYHNCDKTAHRDFMKRYIQGQMKAAAEKPSLYKPPIENQVTRVGRFLRKTSLDELPQLWNVLRGEMSLVGPRPNVLWEVEAYDSWHNERLEVKPGITGLAQVKGRSGIPFDELVRYDIEYVRHQSFWLDIKIIWWTVSAVLKGEGSA
ncbi:MAG: sugar transferase [Caldilineae bacterium]|nr:MAG: sugar transferase [Caldilineae bacterium]